MGTQLVFSVDPNTCIKCKTCEMSCNEYYGLTDVHRRNVLTYISGQGESPIHLSIACNHCINPVCMYVCSENNFQKRRDGIVVLDASRCKGCQKCVKACPYQAPKLNPITNRVDKCNFCVDRINEGLRPICVENCVTGALGMMVVDTKELKANNLKNSNLPITSFMTPSVYIIEKQKKYFFTREG